MDLIIGRIIGIEDCVWAYLDGFSVIRTGCWNLVNFGCFVLLGLVPRTGTDVDLPADFFWLPYCEWTYVNFKLYLCY